VATTTAKAFDEFKAALLLTDKQKQLVASRRSSAEGYLKEAFGSSSNMPLERTKLIGSAGRDVIIRPLDDIDVLAVFRNKDRIFETYRNDSQAFLYRIRNALNQYQVKIVGARGQAVRLFYTDPPHVDIAPVFKWSGTDAGYALPDGKGGWLTTDPDRHESYMAERNVALSSQLKPLVRMLKRWNRVHSKRFKSFHLEVVTATVFSSLAANSREATTKFFEWAPSHLSVNDPAGHSGDLSSYLSWQQRQEVEASLNSSAERARKALEAENRTDHKEAIRLWRIIYGDEFPAYG
jgi:hypothetical protein